MNSMAATVGTAAVKSKINSAVGSVTGENKATGYLGPYCKCRPLGFSVGTTVRMSLLCSMIFFLFIAMCVSSLREYKYRNPLTNQVTECTCTHTQKIVCESPTVDKPFKDLTDLEAAFV